ncbi:MAG: hypothetical protein KJZ78_02110 [Bryobacteraceae bacterium]|nr:hypothetical protein [Bryobacteraceae bacterium]
MISRTAACHSAWALASTMRTPKALLESIAAGPHCLLEALGNVIQIAKARAARAVDLLDGIGDEGKKAVWMLLALLK